jgi:polysaccharide biosynthesis/export protein
MKSKLQTSLNKIRSFILPVLAATLLFASCTPQNRLTYIRDTQGLGDHMNLVKQEYRLKPGDILHVRIMSTDAETNIIFNLDDTRRYAAARAGIVGDQQMFLFGYTINTLGEIQLPVIGSVSVAGLSLAEAHTRIREMAANYIIDATVAVKIVNFSVTVLGEVRNPGNFYIYDHDFTVMGALGLAGDLTDYGNRNIHLMRRTADGLQFHRLDITDRLSVSSELYYLQPNDLIYVEPLLAKRFGFAQFPFAVFFSAISTTLLLISFIIQ